MTERASHSTTQICERIRVFALHTKGFTEDHTEPEAAQIKRGSLEIEVKYNCLCSWQRFDFFF